VGAWIALLEQGDGGCSSECRPWVRPEAHRPIDLPTYVTGDPFAAIDKACETARMPTNFPFPAADWWRALVVMGYLTGWRISDMMGLRRADLDLDAATAITRAKDNKGNRDELVKLHHVVIDHLRKLACFEPFVFPWHHDRRTLHTIFAEVQEAAKIHLRCDEVHEHRRFCHVYGLHDLLRAFATMNVARQMDAAVASLHVPEVLKENRHLAGMAVRYTRSAGRLYQSFPAPSACGLVRRCTSWRAGRADG
jgi:integrase